MKTLSLDASDEEILNAVREWVGLLVEERYADACAFLCQARSSHPWTPEVLAALIQNDGSFTSGEQDHIRKVTSLQDALPDPLDPLQPRHDVHRYRAGASQGYVWFDLPLNGYWSDLTATLEIFMVDQQLVLELTDIEVM